MNENEMVLLSAWLGGVITFILLLPFMIKRDQGYLTLRDIFDIFAYSLFWFICFPAHLIYQNFKR